MSANNRPATTEYRETSEGHKIAEGAWKLHVDILYEYMRTQASVLYICCLTSRSLATRPTGIKDDSIASFSYPCPWPSETISRGGGVVSA